uniref:Calmodulin-binding protein 60 A-like n=1 Tax=Ananas comosus var. bracteatus TaxID=296719 RepID=A0A6V7Q974_ANACO|nr:unnamed protein product [Ananas comosus var. bracteatus]
MSQKRQPDEPKVGRDAAGSPEEKRQKVPALKGVIAEVMRTQNIHKFVAAVEPLIRKVVKEEVESAFANYLSSMTRQSVKEISPSTSRSLQLQFKNKLSLPIFTGARIEGEDSSGITIILVDAVTGQVITSGQESSMKVEIVVLEGDFEGDEEDNWTFEEFSNNIVKEREGKRSLLTGDVFVDLKQGIGVVGELSFTDNSSWTRSRKFKLGARTADGYFNGVRVREAKTESFMVKDHRGELYKKHHPPSLVDEVWRLEKIGKDGAFHKRLACENINTVKDFLTLLSLDATRLRNILGSGMSAKMWEATVEHARTCVLTEQLHIYYHPDGENKAGVVFNVVGEVMGLVCDQRFLPIRDLEDKEKEEARVVVKLAYQHWSSVLACDARDLLGKPLHSFQSATESPGAISGFSSPVVEADCFDLSRSSMLSPDIFSIGATRIFDACTSPVMVSAEESRGDMERFHSSLVYNTIDNTSECSGQPFLGDDSWGHFIDSGIPAFDTADIGAAVTGFIAMSTRKTTTHSGKSYKGWRMLSSVLRWVFNIKKVVASKRKLRGKEKFGWFSFTVNAVTCLSFGSGFFESCK